MSFQSPLWLLALFAVAAFLVLYVIMQRRRSRYAVRFTNVNLLANVAAQRPGVRRHVPPVLFLVALALLALAIARPETEVQVPRDEATVVLVFDVSGSMNARDVEPTRLIAAQQSANEFLERIPERFRVGMVSFSHIARTVLPPTHDRDLARDAIARLRAEGGTAMGDAIMEALDALQAPSEFDALPVDPNAVPPGSSEGAEAPPPSVILLLSDGANTAGEADPIEAAQLAAQLGVPVFTIALGTNDGVVDVPDQRGIIRRVAVPPDEPTLRQIADLTGGEFSAAATDDQLARVYEGLSSKVGFDTEKSEVTWYFALAAALFLFAGASLSLFWFNRFP
jgi:Ca-activated chloride channel homolog